MQDVWLTGQPDAQRRITFKLDSGRLVWVVTFRYRGTYDGLLEGRPTDEINRQIVEAELKTARRAGSGAVQLLAPPTRTDDRGGVYLPPVCCRAELESSPMNREMHGSSLIVVWFAQRFFAEPLADFVPKSLRAVKWELDAKDFEF